MDWWVRGDARCSCSAGSHSRQVNSKRAPHFRKGCGVIRAGGPRQASEACEVFSVHTLRSRGRSLEIRGLMWHCVDLIGKRLFVKTQATRRSEQDKTKTEASIRMVPIPTYLIPLLEGWKKECPATNRGLVFPGEPNSVGERGPISADKLLRISCAKPLRRPACRKYGFTSYATWPAHSCRRRGFP